MASQCFAALLLVHHLIHEPEEIVRDPLTDEEQIISGGDRPCTEVDIPSVPDGVAYDLAVQHLGITRPHAAFLRWTFDRTGQSIDPDPMAVTFWAAMPQLPQDDELLPFAESAAIREAAYAVLGEDLADDYLRATDRHPGLSPETRLNAGIRLLAQLTGAAGE